MVDKRSRNYYTGSQTPVSSYMLNFKLSALAVGTAHGALGVCSSTQGCSIVSPVAVFVAHRPVHGKQDVRFGQLTKQ